MLTVRRLRKSGFNPASLPVATTSLFYTAKNSQDALSEYYPHINAGMLTLRGGGYRNNNLQMQ